MTVTPIGNLARRQGVSKAPLRRNKVGAAQM